MSEANLKTPFTLISDGFNRGGGVSPRRWRGKKLTFGNSIVQGLAVELDVPDLRSTILGFSGLARIDEPLLRGRVCADQRNQVTLVEAHVIKAGNHLLNGVVDVWDETLRGCVPGLTAANPRSDWGSAGADDDCEDAGHLEGGLSTYCLVWQVKGRDVRGEDRRWEH